MTSLITAKSSNLEIFRNAIKLFSTFDRNYKLQGHLQNIHQIHALISQIITYTYKKAISSLSPHQHCLILHMFLNNYISVTMDTHHLH